MDEYIAWDFSVPGISFNVVSGRITIFKATLVAMGYPEYFRFLFSPEDLVFGIEPCAIDDGGAQRLPDEITREHYDIKNTARLRKSGVSEIDADERLRSMEEKPAEPKSNWCTLPFYFYQRADAARIQDAITDGCGTDAPGSLVAWMCHHASSTAWKCREIGTISGIWRAISR